MTSFVVIAHNIRSTHNVGAIFRTAEGFGINRIILSGYTPHPLLGGSNNQQKETRLPHIANKLQAQINKTALGAEELVSFEYQEVLDINTLTKQGYTVVGLEQAPNSQVISSYKRPDKIALILGEEVNGIPKDILARCQDVIEIPMKGHKESFNVSVAAGIAMYELSK